MAILGYCRANQKRAKHIITTRIEHPSVLSPFEQLKNEGFTVSYAEVDRDGKLDLEGFSKLLSDDVLLVSIMAANNETGTLMPVNKIKAIIKEKAPRAILHSDAVQAFGKIPLTPAAWGIDMMSISAHKIHGVKGCGALYMANEHIKPLLFGGGQQKDLRSGTENVPGIAAFGAAAEMVDTNNKKMPKFRLAFKKAISDRIENVVFNGSDDEQTGYVLNASFKGIKSEILLHMLEAKGIYVSTGSACSSNKPMPSHVLSAMGCSNDEISGAVRFSFCKPLSDNEIDFVSDSIAESVAEIRKYMR